MFNQHFATPLTVLDIAKTPVLSTNHIHKQSLRISVGAESDMSDDTAHGDGSAASSDGPSPVVESGQRRILEITDKRQGEDDTIHSINMNEATSFTGPLHQLRSPVSQRRQYRSLNEELEDVTESFASRKTNHETTNFDSFVLEHEESQSNMVTATVSEPDLDCKECVEDDAQSQYSMGDAQVLEARAQIMTRLTPSPLQPRRIILSPIVETSPESTPTSQASTTLVELSDAQHQLPSTSNELGFSPFADDSVFSRCDSQSPCERLHLAHHGLNLLGAAPTRPSPLRQSLTINDAIDQVLDVNDEQVSNPTASPTNVPPTPIQSEVAPDRSSIDLSKPLQVPLEPMLGSLATNDGRINGGDLLMVINAFLAHGTPAKREWFAGAVQTVLSAHGVAIVSSDATPLSSEAVSSMTAVQSPLPVVFSHPVCKFADEIAPLYGNLEAKEGHRTEVTSNVDVDEERPFVSFAADEILDKLVQNNENMRDMIIAWNNVQEADEPSSPFSPTMSSPPSSTERGPLRSAKTASFSRVALSNAKPLSTDPAKQGSKHTSTYNSHRFSSHTFASFNRSLQTTETMTLDTPRRSRLSNVLTHSPNLVASAPSDKALRPPSSKANLLNQENNDPSRLPVRKLGRLFMEQPLRSESPNLPVRPIRHNEKTFVPKQARLAPTPTWAACAEAESAVIKRATKTREPLQDLMARMKDKRTLSPFRDLSKISGESISSSQVRGKVYVENAKDKIAAVQEELRERRMAETSEEEEEVVMNEMEEPIPQVHELNDEQMYTTLANQRATDEVLDTTTLPHATLSRLVARQQAPAAKCSFSPIRA